MQKRATPWPRASRKLNLTLRVNMKRLFTARRGGKDPSTAVQNVTAQGVAYPTREMKKNRNKYNEQVIKWYSTTI